MYEEVVQQLSTLDDWPLVDRWEAILRETLLGGPEKVRGGIHFLGSIYLSNDTVEFFCLMLKLHPKIDTQYIQGSVVLMFCPCSQLTGFFVCSQEDSFRGKWARFNALVYQRRGLCSLPRSIVQFIINLSAVLITECIGFLMTLLNYRQVSNCAQILPSPPPPRYRRPIAPPNRGTFKSHDTFNQRI